MTSLVFNVSIINKILVARHTQDSRLLLGQCWASAEDAGPALTLPRVGALCMLGKTRAGWPCPLVSGHRSGSRIILCLQQTQDVESVLLWRWSNVVDGRPALYQTCFTVLCLVCHIFSPVIPYPIAKTRKTLPRCFLKHDCVRNRCRFLFFCNGSATASMNVLLNEQFILLIIHNNYLYLYCTF